VFLPGAAGRLAFWRPVAERLADLGPAVEIGWPGFGGRPAEPGLESLDDLYVWLLGRLPPGRCHLVAMSMGGVLAMRVALDHPERVDRLVLVATSGGLDVTSLGGTDWRPDYRAELPLVPAWFLTDRTDLSARLGDLTTPTLLLWGRADAVSPLAVGQLLAARLPAARLLVVPGEGHLFAEERPDEVARAIRAFLTDPA
jgi:poly(3-hydroxyoctanoate) depolymerase